jgi:hypothetical protein
MPEKLEVPSGAAYYGVEGSILRDFAVSPSRAIVRLYRLGLGWLTLETRPTTEASITSV